MRRGQRLRHGRHADGVAAERADGADLRRSLKLRAGHEEIDALLHADAELVGAGLCLRAQLRRVHPGDVKKPWAEFVDVPAAQGTCAVELDLVGDQHEIAGLKAKERAARLEALQTLPSLEKYRELYKGRELTDYDLANLWPRRDVDAFLSERGLEYRQIQKKLREAGDQITLKLLEIHNEDEREAWLEKTMEEEKRAKLLDLIGRIMSTVGTITDAAALYIGPEGDINGIIVGTEGKAKIQTIGAGGYNIQCFHFRTLIHEIK